MVATRCQVSHPGTVRGGSSWSIGPRTVDVFQKQTTIVLRQKPATTPANNGGRNHSNAHPHRGAGKHSPLAHRFARLRNATALEEI